jgi:RHS repeat-associated protein
LNNPFLTGYERDVASGLDYANARMYNNGRGRFMQPDPIGLASSESGYPLSLNLYSYVNNDPVNYTDPTGLLICLICGTPYDNTGWWYDFFFGGGGGSGGGRGTGKGDGGGAGSQTQNIVANLNNTKDTIKSFLKDNPDCDNRLNSKLGVNNANLGDSLKNVVSLTKEEDSAAQLILGQTIDQLELTAYLPGVDKDMRFGDLVKKLKESGKLPPAFANPAKGQIYLFSPSSQLSIKQANAILTHEFLHVVAKGNHDEVFNKLGLSYTGANNDEEKSKALSAWVEGGCKPTDKLKPNTPSK